LDSFFSGSVAVRRKCSQHNDILALTIFGTRGGGVLLI
jgi:hypothetical protein